MSIRDGEFWSTVRSLGDVEGQWQEILSMTHLPWSVRVGDGAFEAWVRRWWINDLALLDCACSPCSGTRQRRHIAETDGEFVVVLINRGGRETVSQGAGEASLRPGDAVVWDSAHAARFAVHEQLSKRSLLIPRAALDEVSGRSWTAPGVMLDGASPATRLLVSYLDTLARSLPVLGASAVAGARNATLELLVGALKTDGDVPVNPRAQPALRAAMDRYIERHLLDGALSLNQIAVAHGVSVRTVNRVFNAGGQTVGEVIRVRRLARAREELAESGRPVSVIAHRWGFADPSHFTRSFKAHYGSSPREYRLACRGGGTSVQVPGA